MNVFGLQIREEREKQLLSVEMLGFKSGLGGETIEQIEEGVLHPNVAQLFKISASLGKQPGHFFTKLVR